MPSQTTSKTIPRRRRRRWSPKLWQVFIGLGSLTVVALAATVGLLQYIFTLMDTTAAIVSVDGETRYVSTRAQTVEQLLSQMGITLHEGDVLSTAPQQSVQENMSITVQRARSITITVDDASRVYKTVLINPAHILEQVNIPLFPDDYVLLDGTIVRALDVEQWQLPVNHIYIRRAVNITIVDGDTETEWHTAAQTVGDVLHAAGIELYLADEVDPPANASIAADMTITIQRALPATLIVDGTTLNTRTNGANVIDILNDAQVTLMGLDYTIPAEDVSVRPNMTVRVIRVREELVSETQIIPFGSTEQLDPSLELDQVRLVEPGINGLRRTSTRVRYENGVPIDQTPEGSIIIREPQDRVVAYGSGVVARTIETEQGTREYWRKLRLYATSYHPAALGGDNITATGRILTKGIVGIDPDLIPYGTELYIPGYGIGIAADTGAPRNTTRWIDLGYDDANFEIWARYTDVYILTPVPDDVQYILPD